MNKSAQAAAPCISTTSLPMVAPLRWLPRVVKAIPVTLHHDHLGSINTITDANRNIIEQRSFDAFGRVRQADWGNTLALLSSPITRGYTGHENIGLGLVHMNGRVYDPDLGRFLSPDPYIQAPKNLQSYNRYAYVINNPLSYTDPSGYFFKKARKKFKKTVKRATSVVKSVTRSTAQSVVNINGATLRTINSNKITGTIARTAACSYGPPACAAYVGASNYAETGSIGGSLKAGLIAGGTAYVTQGINGSELGPAGQVLAHGTVGGITAELQGGSFQQGFTSSVFVAAVAGPAQRLAGGDPVVGITAAAIVGGTASKLSGGKFANGASTAAYLQLFVETSDYYKRSVGQEADIRPGENRLGQTIYKPDEIGRQPRGTERMNVVGNNDLTSACRQGSRCSKALNALPGINATARLHDYWFNAPDGLTQTRVMNVGTMLPAAAISYSAIVGNSLQGWQDNPMNWH